MTKMINTWVELEKKKLEMFYSMNNFMDQITAIIEFEKGETKSLYDAQERYKLIIKRCYLRNLNVFEQLKYFSKGFYGETIILVNALAGDTM